MDPISLLLAALAAGAAAALKESASDAVKEAYGGLKALVKRKLGRDPLAQQVVDKHEQAPETWEKPLQEELGKTDAADDAELLAAAQKLLELVDPNGARSGKYNVTITGGKGIVVGDHAHVEMTFEDGD